MTAINRTITVEADSRYLTHRVLGMIAGYGEAMSAIGSIEQARDDAMTASEAATEAATDAGAAADRAALYDGPRVDTFAQLADISTADWPVGGYAQVRSLNQWYQRMPTSAASWDITLPDGRFVNVIPIGGYNVLAFGADPTGELDSTAAFNKAGERAAIVPRKRVYIPSGIYQGAGIIARNGVEWIGENRFGVILRVNQNDRGFFEWDGTLYEPKFKNMTLTIAAGVTGARGFKQLNLMEYFAYPVLENVETRRDLRRSYEVNPIFLFMQDCRDGYQGSAVAGQTHQCMSAKFITGPGAHMSPNLNSFDHCQFFYNDDPDGVFDLEHGWSFNFRHCDFERNATRVMRALSVHQVKFDTCWFEGNGTSTITHYFRLGTSPIAGAHGTSVMLTDCTVDFAPTQPISRFILADGAAVWGVQRTSFRNVPAGCSLGGLDGSWQQRPTLGIQGVQVLSGPGAANFLDFQFQNLERTYLQESVRPTAGMAAVPIYVINPVTNDRLVYGNTGAVLVNATDIPSLIQLGDSLRMTATDGLSWGAKALPDKLLPLIRGKEVTVAIGAHWLTSGGDELIRAVVWENITPTGGSVASYTSTPGISSATTAYGITFVTFTVDPNATALTYGFRVGGTQSGRQYQVERVCIFRGKSIPDVL